MDDIEELVIEEDRPAHIAKHEVSIKEIREVLLGDYAFVKAKLERWMVIGKTSRGKFLAVVLGTRKKKGVYGLVTARSAKRKERNFYKEFLKVRGGKENEN